MTFGLFNPQTGQTQQQGSMQQPLVRALMGAAPEPSTGQFMPMPMTGGAPSQPGLPPIPPLTSVPGVTTPPTTTATPIDGPNGGLTFGSALRMFYPGAEQRIQDNSAATPDWLLASQGLDPTAAFDPSAEGWRGIENYFDIRRPGGDSGGDGGAR